MHVHEKRAYTFNFPDQCFTACGSVIGSVSVGEHYAAGGSSEWCTLSGTAYDFHSFEFNGQVFYTYAFYYFLVTRFYLDDNISISFAYFHYNMKWLLK